MVNPLFEQYVDWLAEQEQLDEIDLKQTAAAITVAASLITPVAIQKAESEKRLGAIHSQAVQKRVHAAMQSHHDGDTLESIRRRLRDGGVDSRGKRWEGGWHNFVTVGGTQKKPQFTTQVGSRITTHGFKPHEIGRQDGMVWKEPDEPHNNFPSKEPNQQRDV
jgi:hypothetical protein